MPGKGRRGLSKDEELNLVPVMNLVSILIPFLVMASSQLQIAVIDSTMPAIADSPPKEIDEDEDVPLLLNIVITDQGFSVRHNKLPDEEEDAKPSSEDEEEEGGPEVPCTDKSGNRTADCAKVFSGSQCVERREMVTRCLSERNEGAQCAQLLANPECVADNYSYAGLTKYVADVKNEYGKVCPYIEGSVDYGSYDPCAPGLDESTLECDRTVILAPEGDIPYSVLIRTMDAVREEDRRGNPRTPDGSTPAARTVLSDLGMDEEAIAKALGSFDPESPTDARVDIAGSRITRKVCQQDVETGERSIGNMEIANELFPYVVIAGGTTIVKAE
jgi:hypothetical protein